MKSSTHRAAVQAAQIYCTCGLPLLTACCIRNSLPLNKLTGTDTATALETEWKNSRKLKEKSEEVKYLEGRSAESWTSERQG